VIRELPIAALVGVALCASFCGGQGAVDVDGLRRAISGIEEGASADDVSRLLGEPEEVRREGQKLPWIVGAEEEWAYGVLGGPGGFAAGGLVLFDAEQRVMLTRLPDAPESLRPGADRIPLSENAVAAPSGMSCRLDRVRPQDGGVAARVTLHNAGKRSFRFTHDHTGIGGNLVVELFDAGGRLLCRSDMMSLHSPYEPDSAKWPELVIEPGEDAGEDVWLGWRWREFGALPPGRYGVRVAFPFEGHRFSPSQSVAFELSEALR
jgi:hypothetical protein